MSAIIGVMIIMVIMLLLFASWRLSQKRKYYRSVTTKLPTMAGIPFIGVAHKMLDITKLFHNISVGCDTLKTSTACVWMATTPYVVTVDPEIIKHVTTSPEFLNKAKDLYTHFSKSAINGIIVSPAKVWKSNRKAVSPFLAHNNIMSLFPAFNQNANNVKNKLESLAGQGEQDIFTIVKECGLQLSLLTIMGIKVEEDSDKHKKLLQSFTALIDNMGIDLLLGWLGLRFLSHTPHYKRIVKYLQDLVQTLITENLHSEDMNNFAEGQRTMIDLGLKALRQGVFSEKDVEIECFTMFAAAYETSVSASYTCLVMLAMQPEIQERVFQEIRSVFPQEITSVEYDDLKKLPYLDMFIAESLRLAPPIQFIGRQSEQDAELCPGVILPKGMQVVIPIYELHRRKEIWGPDAHRFNPNNFLPENIEKRHPYSYMPFSKGSRNCIGFRYAEVSLRIILIHAVRSLKFSTTFKYEDIVHVPHISLRYKIQPPLRIQVRAN